MYGKIFDSLWKGSMRGKGNLQLVFIHMICNCDQDGICDYIPQVIADDTGMPLYEVEGCITELEAPDPLSRTPDEQGRRIIRLSEQRLWGWRIVNHITYRERLSDAWKKEKAAERQRKHREKCNSNAQKRDSHASSASASASFSDIGELRGGHTLQECINASEGIGIKPEDVTAFFNHYASQGWKKGNGQLITSLPHALTSWKLQQTQRDADRKERPQYGKIKRQIKYV